MSQIGSQKESEAKIPPPPTRPDIDGLLLHPIKKSDNGDGETGASTPRSSADVPESEDESASGSYKNWVVHHAKQARFYVGGIEAITAITGFGQAKRYYHYVAQAGEIAAGESWAKAIDGNWGQPISYNQFLKAFNSNKPMFFDIAAQILAACECAVEHAIEMGKYQGSRFDVYEKAKIVPACFNIDEYKPETLDLLRKKILNYESEVLRAAGQRNPHLLNALAEGECVTRPTARAIRKRTFELLQFAGIQDVEIGDVRGRPGRQKLGRGRASSFENVELDDLARY